MKQETYPLLRDAYAIIDGIPEANFILEIWHNRLHIDDRFYGPASPALCGCIGCAGGWLALHPDMVMRGLTTEPDSSLPSFNGEVGMHALAIFFGLTHDEARALFSPNDGHCGIGPKQPGTDKEVWLRRVRQFLNTGDPILQFFRLK